MSVVEFGYDIPDLEGKGVPIRRTFHKGIWGTGGIAPLINLGTTWTLVVSLMPSPLYCQGRSFSPPSTCRMAGWHGASAGCSWRNSLQYGR